MHDRRDRIIAALAAALCFGFGLWIGRGADLLPRAAAQDPAPGSAPAPSTNRNEPIVGPATTPSPRPGFESRTTPHTASDSDSNNRFVAVTTPIGSGESVTFVIDSEKEQLLVYRFVRNEGLRLVAARKIDMDLELSAYNDRSDFSRDELKAMRERERMKNAAKEIKKDHAAK